jgi:C4-dicarboxylate transporter, DctM subunit
MTGFLSPFSICIFAILSLGLLGLPIGYSMIVGSIIYLFMRGLDLGTSAEQILNGLYNSYVLLAVPLFLVSAELMNVSKMTDHLLRFCDMLVGRFKGGLGHINIAQSIIFAGMSGSAIADLAGTGRISIDMMTRNNRYTLSYAAAITAASAVIGPIIPPSIPMVLYALISDTSVGYLFIGGVIPGLLMAVAQMVINTIQAHRHNFPVEPPIPLREWPYIIWIAMPALLMPVILLGGIYSGVVTPTEAAAVAAAYAFLVAAVWYRNISVQDTYDAVLNSARSTASIGLLICGALVFNYVVTVEQIPETVKGLLAGYDLSPNVFLFWVNIILLVLGCLLEGSTIILVILPIFIPTAKALGIDLVHFGVMAVFNIMIGLITPPYGLLLFIISAISGAPLRLIIRDTMPFVYAMIVALFVITYFPELVLWLPRQMGYKG